MAERSKVFIDELDLKVIFALSEKEYSILVLAEKLNVAHYSLMRKIKKMEGLKVIVKDESPKGRKVLLKLNPAYLEATKLLKKKNLQEKISIKFVLDFLNAYIKAEKLNN